MTTPNNLHFPIITEPKKEGNNNVARIRGLAIKYKFDIDVSYNLIVTPKQYDYINNCDIGSRVSSLCDLDHIITLVNNYKRGKDLLEGIPISNYKKIIDYINLSYNKKLEYKCVLLSIFSRYVFINIYIGLLIKRGNPNIDIMVGGPHIELLDQFSNLLHKLNIFDYIIKGDIEEAVIRYMASTLNDLDVVYFDLNNYSIPIYTTQELKLGQSIMFDASRNCPNVCSFCPGGLGKFRSVKLEKIEAVFKYYNVFRKQFNFEAYLNDSTFNYSSKRLYDFLQMLINIKNNITIFSHFVFKNFDPSIIDLFVKSKVLRINFGIDAIHEDKIKYFNMTKLKDNFIEILKELYDQNFDVRVSIVYGSPGETNEIFEYEFEKLKYIRSLCPDPQRMDILPYVYIHNPGSWMYKYPEKYGITHEYWEPMNCSDELNSIITSVPKRYYSNITIEEKMKRYKIINDWKSQYVRRV